MFILTEKTKPRSSLINKRYISSTSIHGVKEGATVQRYNFMLIKIKTARHLLFVADPTVHIYYIYSSLYILCLKVFLKHNKKSALSMGTINGLI